MNTTLWNELAEVYDQKCKVLEEARVAYSEAITKTLITIATDLARRPGLDEEIKGTARNHSYFEPANDPCALLRKSLEYNVPGPCGAPIVSVRVRFSSPWEHGPGLLQFGLLSRDPKWTAVLHDRVCADEWVAIRTSRESNVSDWIYSESLSLSGSDPIPTASKLVEDLLRLGYRILADLCRMERLFGECRRRLEEDAEIKREFPKVIQDEWETPTYRFVQLNREIPSYYGFWLGYEAEKRSLLLGYNGGTIGVESQLQKALQQKIGVEKWEKYSPVGGGAQPGGTIMTAAQLKSASDKQILEIMMNAFKTYVQVVMDSEPASLVMK